MSVALDTATASDASKDEFDAEFDLGRGDHVDSTEPAQACCADPWTYECTVPC